MAVEKFDYLEAQEDARELLEEFGREITISRAISGYGPAHNPGQSHVITGLATAVVLPASKGTIEAFDNRIEGGTLIDEKLRYVMMLPKIVKTSPFGPEAFEPQSLDVLTFDGYDWTVLGCTPLNPAGTPVLYSMGVKR